MFDRLSRLLSGLLLFAPIAACAPDRQPAAAAAAEPVEGLVIAIEDVLVPEVFEFEDEVAIGSPEDGAGFWAAVPGLDRPERALLQSLTTGSTAVAALFRASPGSRLIVSFETARAIGVSDLETAPVRIRAIRSEVRLGAPPTGF